MSRFRSWHRISMHVSPLNYVISIQPYMHTNNSELFYFKGKTSIRIKVHNATRFIAFHVAPNLKFNKSKITIQETVTKTKVSIETIEYIIMKKWMILVFNKNLKLNSLYDIHFPMYTSKLETKENGLYLQKYWDNNKKKYGASVLLSPFYAKKVLPCFDDPIFESYIQLNIIRRKGWKSQSIMSIKETKPLPKLDNGEWEIDIYESTPLMQIYEFTFTINQFSFISTKTNNGVEIKLWAPKSNLKFCKESLKNVKTAIEFYEMYFNNKYSFKKLDVTVVSSMPNFETGSSTYGLLILIDKITYIEPSTLPRSKETYRNIINHEIAHQWVGNNLRIEWFDSLWLIEGLAGYMEEKMKIAKSSLHHKMSTGLRQSLTGLYTDDTILSHNLSQYPANAADVEFYFDDLIFLKGFSMVKMLDRILGPKEFRRVVSEIMNNKNKKPMSSDEIWKLMDKELKYHEYDMNPMNPEIYDLMRNWQNQPGYPIIFAKRPTFDKLVLRQTGNQLKNRYLIWRIPLTYITEDGDNQTDHKSIKWFQERYISMKLKKDLSLNKWYLLNPDMTAFIRINYDTQNWVNLIRQLQQNHIKIPALARLEIIDDLYYFFRNGYLEKPEIIIDLLLYLKKETDLIIWRLVKTILHVFRSVLHGSPFEKAYETKVLKMIHNVYSQIKWKVDNVSRDYTLNIRDALAAKIACSYGSVDCEKRGKLLLDDLIKTKKFGYTYSHLYFPLLCASLRNATDEIYNKTLDIISKDILVDVEQDFILTKALTCSKNPKHIKRFWNTLLIWKNEKSFKSQWYYFALMNLAENFDSKEFLKDRVCNSTINPEKSTFDMTAVISAINNIDLPTNCPGLIKIKQMRNSSSSGDILEIETGLITLKDRHFIKTNFAHHLQNWLT